MKIALTSIPVDDQSQAEAFYTQKLGFKVKQDVPLGEHRWLTVVSGDAPDGPELLLEPAAHPALGPFRAALMADGIPYMQFTVEHVGEEYERLTGLGVTFTQQPATMGPVTTAVFDDTCGNLVQIVAHN